MNNQLYIASRRQDDMKRLNESLERLGESVKWLYEDIVDTEIIASFESCNSALYDDVYNHVLDLQGFYSTLETEGKILSSVQRMQLMNIAERTIGDLLKLIQLESKERIYLAEMKYIEDKGYIINERYRICFPDKTQPDEEWVVTEFGVGWDGSIYPVHGCKIKKNGDPYKQAQFISLNRRDDYSLTRVDDKHII